MNVRTEPHLKISSCQLADWLTQQGEDRWWNVDGDPVLTGRVSFPCPADELARELRRLDRSLLVLDRRPVASRPTPVKGLDDLVTRLGDGVAGVGASVGWATARVFFLCWDDRGEDWSLVEDQETTERSREDALATQGRS